LTPAPAVVWCRHAKLDGLCGNRRDFDVERLKPGTASVTDRPRSMSGHRIFDAR
jgi:hypothetical protein